MTDVPWWICFALIGGVVCAVVAFFAIVIAAVFIVARFPFRAQFSRDLPSTLVTPSGPFKLTMLAGVSSRWRARWFFGFMLLQPGEASRAHVVTPKPTGEM